MLLEMVLQFPNVLMLIQTLVGITVSFFFLNYEEHPEESNK